MSNFRGISLNHLLSITEDIKHQSTNDFLASVIAPATAERKESYADLLIRTGRSELVKDKADAFISHAWAENVQDTLASVKRGWELEHAKTAEERKSLANRLSEMGSRKSKGTKNADVYVFFDVFVVNQHTSAENPHEWWESVFGKAVRNMEHTFVALNSWQKPRMLERCWCIFEIACSSKVVVCLKPSQERLLEEVIVDEEKFPQVIKALSGIDAANSKATTESDREAIFSTISSTLGGFAKVNKAVLDQLRNWLLDTARKASLRNETNVNQQLALLRGSGNLLLQLGQISEAVKTYSKVLEEPSLKPSRRAMDEISLAAALFELRDESSLVKSEELFNKAFAALSLSPQSSKRDDMLAQCLNDKGLVERALGRDSKALETFQEARKLASSEEMQMNCLLNYSECLSGLGNPEDAILGFQEVLDDFVARFSNEHPSVAQVENLMGMAYRRQGDTSVAKELYQASLRKRIKALGEQHQYVGFVVKNLLELDNLSLAERHEYNRIMEVQGFPKILDLPKKRPPKKKPQMSLTLRLSMMRPMYDTTDPPDLDEISSTDTTDPPDLDEIRSIMTPMYDTTDPPDFDSDQDEISNDDFTFDSFSNLGRVRAIYETSDDPLATERDITFDNLTNLGRIRAIYETSNDPLATERDMYQDFGRRSKNTSKNPCCSIS